MSSNNQTNSNWTVGQVRTRAKASDPFAGLRGREYVLARRLNTKPIERLDAKQAEQVKSESRENLIKAINERTLDASLKDKFVFASGSIEPFNNAGNRRFLVVHKSHSVGKREFDLKAHLECEYYVEQIRLLVSSYKNQT